MKLILTGDVPNLGAPGDIVEVKDGYGRNYLLPRGLAVVATRGAEKQVDAIRRARTSREIRDLGHAREVAAQLGDLTVTVKAKAAGDSGRLFGSVTAADIAQQLESQGLGFDLTQEAKVLLANKGYDPALGARFTREAQTLATLSHTNIVHVYDFGIQNGRAFLVMELVTGVDLVKEQIRIAEGERVLVRVMNLGNLPHAIHSHGHDPGMEIIESVWPGENPFAVSRHELLRAVKYELGSAGRDLNFNAYADNRSIFRYDMEALPNEVTGSIGTSTAFAAWNAAVYVAQIEDDRPATHRH